MGFMCDATLLPSSPKHGMGRSASPVSGVFLRLHPLAFVQNRQGFHIKPANGITCAAVVQCCVNNDPRGEPHAVPVLIFGLGWFTIVQDLLVGVFFI